MHICVYAYFEEMEEFSFLFFLLSFLACSLQACACASERDAILTDFFYPFHSNLFDDAIGGNS